MKLLLLLSSLLIIAIPNANARILQGNKYDMVMSIYGRPPLSSSSSSSPEIINSAGRETFDVISSVSGRQPPPNPPPSPIPSPSHNPSTRGSSSPCDHDTTKNYNNKIKWRISDITIRSPPPPINSAGRDEFDMISSVCGREGQQPPPSPPKSSTPIHTLGMRRTPPALICMPGRPCTDGFIIVSS
ncbi:hypothetical protein TIFTF001_005898 [Ficus carica]|uniref:Uncharacterized protein n=1 Tax=Ficus carica TaxID=3494 RepID=A0AA88CY37_FICCA|nr:hypothetical protein TIFTF001_005898 [Ficus carica]